MNSFRAVFRALSFEVERQREVLESRRDARPGDARLGRGSAARRSRSGRRSTPTTIATSRSRTCRRCGSSATTWRAFARQLPELPDAKERRFIDEYGLSEYEAHLLTETRARADFFEAVPVVAGQGATRSR